MLFRSFSDERGMSIKNMRIVKEVDGGYLDDSATINSIPIPDRSTYGDDYVISVDEA